MIIGITGSIGSGKSYVLEQIKNLGYEVYQTDKITLEAYNDKNIKKELDENFHCLINDDIDKAILKSKINDDIDNLNTINKIIHPFIYEKVKSLDKNGKLIFVEIPLLFEANFDKICKVTISITMDENIRYKMLENRNKSGFNFYKKLEKQQYSSDKKNSLADFVINNDLNKENLLLQINNIIEYCNKLL